MIYKVTECRLSYRSFAGGGKGVACGNTPPWPSGCFEFVSGTTKGCY